MKALITGASGLFGSYLQKCAPESAFLYTDRVEILDKDAIASAFDSFEPEVVIHLAGEGSVDRAEANMENAYALNVVGTQNLLEAAAKHEAHFVYISTNAIYDGFKAPYSEESPRKPINYYGVSKVAAEDEVFKYAFKSSVYRLIFLYGWTPKSSRAHFMTRVFKSLKAGEQVRVAKDIFTQPTHALDAASTAWGLLQAQEGPKDVFNIAPRKTMSLYAFALDIAAAFGFDPSLIVPTEHAELPGLARRPKNTSFDVTKLELAGFSLPPPSEGLVAMMGREDAA